MKKKNKKYIFIFSGIIILLIVGYFVFIKVKPTNFIEINGMYDANHNLIEKSLSVIGGVEGVKYITLNINVENLDSVPLDLIVKDMTPAGVLSAKPITTLKVNSGDIGKWTTGEIDIESYEGTLQEFCVTVESLKIPTLRESSEISGCISIQVDPNPSGTFDISLDSNIGDGIINPGCTESWACSVFGTCSNGIQTRICNDLNNCGTTLNKPTEEQICGTPSFETNAINGDYKIAGVWIKVNGITYSHQASSSYSCLSENIFTSTPEGNSICTRPGYTTSQRVHMQYGTGSLLFTP